MRPYLNLSGKSGVRAYDLGPDFIDVEFVNRHEPYRYSAEGVGRENVAEMQRRAVAGRGLGTFISQHPEVRNGYDQIELVN